MENYHATRNNCIPSQGDHTALFQTVGKHLIRKVYKTGWLFRTHIRPGGHVSVALISSSGGGPEKVDFWSQISQASSFLTISHCGEYDGPNLAHNDKALTTTDDTNRGAHT